MANVLILMLGSKLCACSNIDSNHMITVGEGECPGPRLAFARTQAHAQNCSTIVENEYVNDHNDHFWISYIYVI